MLIGSPASNPPPSFNVPNSTSINEKSESKSTASISNGDQARQPNSSSGRENQQQEISQQRELLQLKNTDREVRAHELAHLSVAGRYATSGASFSYQKGPDGRLYAVSGEVGIDTSKIPGDPRATLLKAQTIMRAALAPANPSAQDRNVAAQASALAQQARIEISQQQKQIEASAIGINVDTFA